MTELQQAYEAFRTAGCRHREAIDKTARRYGLDPGTVRRCLERAGTDDKRAGRPSIAREREARVVAAYRISGATYRSVADQFGIGVGLVKQLVKEARCSAS